MCRNSGILDQRSQLIDMKDKKCRAKNPTLKPPRHAEQAQKLPANATLNLLASCRGERSAKSDFNILHR